MNSNLKQSQKTINNSQPATFIPRNESKPQSSVLELEQSLINASGLDGTMEKLPNQKTGVSKPNIQNCGPSLSFGKQYLGGKMATVVQEKKTSSINIREQNRGNNIEERSKIMKERQILNENSDRKVGDILVGGKQMENLHRIGGYNNNVVNNKYGKQKIDEQYVKGNNINNGNKQGCQINVVQNRVNMGNDGTEKRDRRENMGHREDIGIDVNKRVRGLIGGLSRNEIEQEISLGLEYKNRGKHNINIGQQHINIAQQQYSSVLNSRTQRIPSYASSSPLPISTSNSLYQAHHGQQSVYGTPLINPPTAINHRNSNSGMLWNNSMDLSSSSNMGLRNSNSNLGMMMMGSGNIQSGGVNNNVKSGMYESNGNHHHMGYLLGGLFENSHMIDNQNMLNSGNMSNLNSNSLLRRFSTNTHTPVSTLLSSSVSSLLSSSNKHSTATTSQNYQHQPIYHKQPKLVMNPITSNIASKQLLPTNKYIINSSNTNNNNNNDTNNTQLNSNIIINANNNNSINQNNLTQNIQPKDPVQQARAIVYANKDKKNNQPQIIVLDSEDQQQLQQKLNINQQQKENQQKEISTNVKTVINQSDLVKSSQSSQIQQPNVTNIQQPNIAKSFPTQQNTHIKSAHIQQSNQIKTPQIPMPIPNTNPFQSPSRSFLSYNTTTQQQQYTSYLNNYLNKQVIYPPSNSSSLLPFNNSISTNTLQYESPYMMDYYNQSTQLPSSSISNVNNSKSSSNAVNSSGKQYKQALGGQRSYELNNSKYLEKTKHIYKQQHHSDSRSGAVYSNVDRVRQLQRQQHKGVGGYLSAQPYYPQYNQYSNIIKGNYPIINPNRPFPTTTNPNINSINSNPIINSSKYPMPSSLTFKSSLVEQKQLDIMNNIDRLKGGYDGLFYNDNQLPPFPNNNQLYEQYNNNRTPTTIAHNKNQHPPSGQQKPTTQPTENKDPAQPNAPKKRNSFYLNSLRQMAQKLQQQINNNNTQGQNSITPQQLQNNKIKLQKIKKQLQGAQHVKKQAQKAFHKTRSKINNQCPPSTKQNDTSKKVTKKDKLPNKDQQKSVNSQISTNVQEKYAFQWTSRLKKLRQLTKKRDFDSVILIGPDFQADIPAFITDRREIRAVVGVKRASLLKRMFKYASEIEEKHSII